MKENLNGLQASLYRNEVGQELAQNLNCSIAQVAVCVQRIVLAVETQSHAVLWILHFILVDKRDLSGRSS